MTQKKNASVSSPDNPVGALQSKIRRQTDELKVRNDQLRVGISKQKLSDEEINIRTKAMEFTSDGIFIIDATKPDFPFIYVNLSFKKFPFIRGKK